MRIIQRIVSAALLGALAILISGCAALNTPSFDPTDWLDFLDSKKRAVGDRHPVFPEGVPGVAQGVPPDLLKGTPEHQAALAAADPTLAPPPAPETRRAAAEACEEARCFAADADQGNAQWRPAGRACQRSVGIA